MPQVAEQPNMEIYGDPWDLSNKAPNDDEATNQNGREVLLFSLGSMHSGIRAGTR